MGGDGMSRGRSIGFVLASLLLGTCMLVPNDAPAAIWEVQKLPFQPRYEGEGEIGPLLGVSCPSSSFCATAGQDGRIATSSNPSAGPSNWRPFIGPTETDDHGPPPPPGFPSLPPPSPHIKGVSCPTPALCIAVTGRGDIYSSSDPGGGTAARIRADIDEGDYETHLEGISCPTVSFCVAVSGGPKENDNPRTSGKILSSSNPAGGSSAWHVTQLDPTLDLRGISCASPSLCVAVGQEGRIVTSRNPDGGPLAWRGSVLDSLAHLQGIACVSGSLCVAGDAGGNLLTATDPVGNPGAWVARNGGGSVPITGISCPSASRCVAVDNNGDVLTSTNPTGGFGSWTFENVIPYQPGPNLQPLPNGMFGVSCPLTTFCAIAAANGTVLTSIDPFEAAPAPVKAGRKARGRKRPRTILAHVDRKQVRTVKRRLRVRFRFYAIGRARGFLCKRDRHPYRPCSSPLAYWTGLGKHVFRVRAIGRTGLKGPVALDRFRIVSPDSKCPCGTRGRS